MIHILCLCVTEEHQIRANQISLSLDKTIDQLRKRTWPVCTAPVKCGLVCDRHGWFLATNVTSPLRALSGLLRPSDHRTLFRLDSVFNLLSGIHSHRRHGKIFSSHKAVIGWITVATVCPIAAIKPCSSFNGLMMASRTGADYCILEVVDMLWLALFWEHPAPMMDEVNPQTRANRNKSKFTEYLCRDFMTTELLMCFRGTDK